MKIVLKRISILILIMFLSFVFFSCHEKEDTKNDIKSQETEIINNLDYSIYGANQMKVGEIMQIACEYEDAKFISNNEQVATVTGDGKVYAIKSGDVEIYYIFNGVKYSLNIIVTDLTSIEDLVITGKSELIVGEACQYYSNYEDVIWESSNLDIATVNETGEVHALKSGSFILSCIKDDAISTLEIIVKEELSYSFNFDFPNNVFINEEVEIHYEFSDNVNIDLLIFDLSDDEEIYLDHNKLIYLSRTLGTKEIKVYYESKNNLIASFLLEVLQNNNQEFQMLNLKDIYSGEIYHLSYKYNSELMEGLVFESLDKSHALCFDDYVLGLSSGVARIKVTPINNNDLEPIIFEINIKKFVQSTDYSVDDLNRVNDIMNQMSIDQKIGQLILIGFDGQTLTSELSNAISNYHFGNVIYMGANVSKPSTIQDMSNAIQTKMVECNLVPAFIATDQEGGTVARLRTNATHFINQMAVGANPDYFATYFEGEAIGQELLYYGINTDFAPVVDVNNNYKNTVIGVRSYSDDPLRVSLFSRNLVNGMRKAGLMGCCKHFPGHGNTQTDSHYGLPIIDSSIEEIKSIELAPYYANIYNGLDAIMSAHIIFKAIDSEYPATLSYKIMTELLREEMGYRGLIFTDSLTMQAITKNFGTYGECALRAINAGVDILTYVSLSPGIDAFNALKEAYNNGTLSIERINESVQRILLKKLKLGILDNYLVSKSDISSMLKEHADLNKQLARDAITNAIGDFNGLDKTKKTLIISGDASYTLSNEYGTLEDDSIACFIYHYLKYKGNNNVKYLTVNNKLTQSNISSINSIIDDYDQIVFAFSNIQKNSYTTTSSYLNNILKNNTKDVIVISLDSPYDYKLYNNLQYYICTYGQLAIQVEALAEFLNGEFKAVGVSAVRMN